MNSNDYDVVIVGAGTVGAALACALGESGLKLAIVEARRLSSTWPQGGHGVDEFDARVSALTPATKAWLEQLQAWPGNDGQRVSPYTFMHVWDAEGTASIEFDAAEVNQPVLGYIVENRVLNCALVRRIKKLTNVALLAPRVIQSLQQTEQGYVLRDDQGQQISTSLVVAADGANSPVRTMAGLALREWDYGHDGIVATVECEHEHQLTAWQRFLPEGPLAFLPLRIEDSSNHLCSIVWSTLPERADELMSLPDEDFCAALSAAFEHRLGRVRRCSQRYRFPLRQRHAVDYVLPGLALVGDAAHTIHPLAGQGVNLGLSDARVLAEELSRAASRQLDAGDLSVLKRYQRRRKADNLLMMAGMEGFKRLFEQDRLPIRWARNAGMRWLNKSMPLKRRIIRQALGV